MRNYFKTGLFISMTCLILISLPSLSILTLINAEIYSKNPKSSEVNDITINYPQDTIYDGGMEGYYPGNYSFEDNNWISKFEGNRWAFDESGGTVAIKNQAQGYTIHKNILDLYDLSGSESVSVSNDFKPVCSMQLGFWVYIDSDYPENARSYIRMYQENTIRIEIKLYDGWISYKKDDGQYENLIQYMVKRWYLVEIGIGVNKDPAETLYGFSIRINQDYMRDLSIHPNENRNWKPYLDTSNQINLNRIEFSTDDGAAFYHLYLDALSYYSGYSPLYLNYIEGYLIDFTCPTNLEKTYFSLDDGPWVDITPKYSAVIPMIGGNEQHSIKIKGIDGNSIQHESPTRYFETKEVLDWGVDVIDAEQVWGVVEDARQVVQGKPAGQGVNVLVIDSGIDFNHPDLAANYKGGMDFRTGFLGDEPMDTYGHGTHCAGIIGAVDNSIGTIGVAPKVGLYAAKTGEATAEKDAVIRALNWAINTHQDMDDTNDIDIISMSFSSSAYGAYNDLFNEVRDCGIILVSTSGNSYEADILPPGSLESVICVGALKYENMGIIRSEFSQTGPELDITAPGVNIFSTMIDLDYLLEHPGYYPQSGTSMACPMVAGVCALILSNSDYNKNFLTGAARVETVKEILLNSATDLGAQGYDEEYGHGMVNASAAMDYVDLEIDSPTHGASFLRGSHVTFRTKAINADGINEVQYRIGSGSWYQANFEQSTNRYKWIWTNTEDYSDGLYTITCRLTDTNGEIFQDQINVNLYTAKEVAYDYNHIKGYTSQGNIQSTHNNDGNWLFITAQYLSGGWIFTNWRSETEFFFDYESFYTYEEFIIEIFAAVKHVTVNIYYTTGGYSGYTINPGSYTKIYNLDPDRPIYKVVLIQAGQYPSSFWYSIDYMWIKHI